MTQPSPEQTDRSTAPRPSTSDAGQDLSTDEIFHLLQNQRRRRVLQYLRAHDEGEGIDMRDVAEWIAAKEHDTTVQALRSKQRQRVYIALYQSHLPKLADAGVIEYDQRKGWLEETDLTAAVDQYVADVVETAETADPTTRQWTIDPTVGAVGIAAVLLGLGQLGFLGPLDGPSLPVALFGLLVATVLWNNRDHPERLVST